MKITLENIFVQESLLLNKHKTCGWFFKKYFNIYLDNSQSVIWMMFWFKAKGQSDKWKQPFLTTSRTSCVAMIQLGILTVHAWTHIFYGVTRLAEGHHWINLSTLWLLPSQWRYIVYTWSLDIWSWKLFKWQRE